MPKEKGLLVVKLGSSTLCDAHAQFDPKRIEVYAESLKKLRSDGYQVVLVSSGAILLGRTLWKTEDKELSVLQSLSAVGQALLMSQYQKAFGALGQPIAQVLVTHEDLKSPVRSLNLKNMMGCLLRNNILPIVNENDSVSYAEITVGDNDQLSVGISWLLGASGLVILTKPNGLYNRDPSTGPAERIPLVPYKSMIAADLKGLSVVGRGGMSSKVEAAQRAAEIGVPVYLGTYLTAHPIQEALDGMGTVFTASPQGVTQQKKQRLLSVVKHGTSVTIDEPAAEALLQGRSLLPSGVKGLKGTFRRGDVVYVVCKRKKVGVGTVEYDAKHLHVIKGAQSGDIESLIGYCPSKVVIHRSHFSSL